MDDIQDQQREIMNESLQALGESPLKTYALPPHQRKSAIGHPDILEPSLQLPGGISNFAAISVFKDGAQLEFMQYQLHPLNNFNTMFGTTEPMLHHFRAEVVKLLSSIMQDLLKLDVLRAGDISIEFDNKSKHDPLKDVNISTITTSTLSSCSDTENALKVRSSCLAFLVELGK
eukprot:gene17033-8541_t